VASAKKLEELLKEMNQLEKRIATLEGEYSQINKTLQDAGYETPQQAWDDLARMDEYLRTAGDEIDREYAKFQEAYGDAISATEVGGKAW